jgi:ATP-dependent protease ClpP protease subunit
MDGLALYDTIQRIRRQGVPVVTRASGLVASMATILLQAGDERIADKNVQILVHELSSSTGGKISGIKDEAAMMDRLNKRLLGILSERSSLTAKQIENRANRKEWWIDADEALKLGFVDRVE